jgi:hypothetical protein
LLFHGRLSDELVASLGLTRPVAQPAPAPAPVATASDGALHLLATLQRDARLVDFLMEDIAAYSDEQVGAAVRSLHEQGRQSLQRYIRLAPVIDGVEGTYATVQDPSTVKFLGNVPAKGTPKGGTLRHKGWRAAKVDLPPIIPQQSALIAPAEIEIE